MEEVKLSTEHTRMRVMVINSGSSTLKFDVMEVASGGGDIAATRRLAHGTVDRIGGEASLAFHSASGEDLKEDSTVRDHGDAVEQALHWLESTGLLGSSGSGYGVDAVGHRVVHGGGRFVAPTLIDDEMLRELERLSELAPLHNPPAIEGIRATRAAFGHDVPMVAVFDTAFHSTLPVHAYAYALPHALAERHGIRRYGFHGTAHEYMLLRFAEMRGTAPSEATIITLQLGNGCSIAAIRNGQPLDTSMGFTPLEGLVMGTRSGDLDPGVVTYLAEKEGMTPDGVDELLNRQSGLLGISGRSGDMRDLLTAEGSDPKAALAVELFCYRARKYIGAYLAALGGAQAVVLGGGIGEHAPSVRARILRGMEWCGLFLDESRNSAITSSEGRITTGKSVIDAYVVTVDEALLIARQTVGLVGGSR
jgi:acetate kinase